MIPIRLATAFTADYKRSVPYIRSLGENCNVPFQLLIIDQDIPGYEMPGSIVQAGYFLDHLKPCETVIFTDADLIMHRPLDADELDFISSLKEGQVSACYNKHPNQLWAEEIPMLYPVAPPEGYDDVRVFNTGFVAAKIGTYRVLFNKFKELWPEFKEAFQHYAKIQLCMCAAANRLGIEWIPTPGHLCSHGHFSCPDGVNPHVFPPTFNERVIAFDHRISH